ncbi:hypothetical protein EST38_g3827 [Candolleomyces aberdarensis]|uniref:Uncharacterized protein n=1 Tax=Candolleomyces aberdarensis TaxID=2316362 RepID=A0A4Q2DSJ7_9AGAR|nr:hypothetical protein EST38_g3827 [Candolleomyces aberdarensis]
MAQLDQIKSQYALHEVLVLKAPKSMNVCVDGGALGANYNGYALLKPRHKEVSLMPGMRDKIVAALATRFNTNVQTISQYFSEDSIEVFGRLRQTFSEAGETIVVAGVVTITAQDARDASYVRYEILVDRNAAYRNKPVDFQLTTCFGQLYQIFLIRLPPAPALDIAAPTVVLLAAIHKCDVELKDQDLDFHYYRNMSHLDLVDITCIKALVGRVAWDGWWAIIDRSGKLSRGHFEDVDDDEIIEE